MSFVDKVSQIAEQLVRKRQQVFVTNTIKHVALPDGVDDVPLSSLPIPEGCEKRVYTRTMNCLAHEEIRTLSDLVQRTPNEICDIKNAGYKALQCVRAMLEPFNLTLKHD
jgi:DNA-directed RNA polymerase alpha subunit